MKVDVEILAVKFEKTFIQKECIQIRCNCQCVFRTNGSSRITIESQAIYIYIYSIYKYVCILYYIYKSRMYSYSYIINSVYNDDIF